jgi:MFS family permease
MNLVATLLGMALIDRIGRKTLLLIGAVGTAVCLLAVAAIFAMHQHQAWLVWALVAYIAFFAISQGAVVWVYISEIFPTRVRGKGQSLGSGTHWVMNAILSLMFPMCAFWGLSLLLFRGNDGATVPCSSGLLPRDEAGLTGRTPTQTQDRVIARFS